ncbi:thiol-disulfide oxidoreductase DCC family protein [Luteibaculum oceani]|uniref:DUF393 domain-containing protein n=1 Tax=Luteibaculum oceani TaxID=1294296 RepID=A0A5C6V957_9FLAO|nr:DCC1-like thiol-disulfide oxidoreductase family protein [Luteibaculum oceani]TXC81647.1 DUF393 domain-containing protein [Luteibaculum oceani]
MKTDILLIDGHCVLCSNLAKWIAKNTNGKAFKIGALQDEELFNHYGWKSTEDLKSVVYVTKSGEWLERSNAIIALSKGLNQPYRFLGNLLKIFPRALRNWVYDIIASSRYRWFGKKEECDLPSEALRDIEIKKPFG